MNLNILPTPTIPSWLEFQTTTRIAWIHTVLYRWLHCARNPINNHFTQFQDTESTFHTHFLWILIFCLLRLHQVGWNSEKVPKSLEFTLYYRDGYIVLEIPYIMTSHKFSMLNPNFILMYYEFQSFAGSIHTKLAGIQKKVPKSLEFILYRRGGSLC